MMRRFKALAAFFCLFVAGSPAAAQDAASRSAPVAQAAQPGIPAASDTPYPGTILLDIDASDVTRNVFKVRQTIPISGDPGRITLLYPQWLPGHHAPRGNLAELAGLEFRAGGNRLSWTRDPLEVYAFHVTVPPGTREIEANFVNTTPFQTSEGRIVMTRDLLNLQWERMSLYPAGHYVRRITVKPTVRFPAGWSVSTALDGKQVLGDVVSWAPVDYETLVDSPIFAGRHFRSWELGNDVRMDVYADDAGNLAATPEQIAPHRRLVDEALATFGSRHFDRYTFLVALTDQMGAIGLEHHRSSENQHEPDAFTDWSGNEHDRSLLPHEFAHSWNGKFRRPVGLWTPDYRTPMQDNLLWVYEGQTQFWGWIHSARSGLMSKQMVLDMIARAAGTYSLQPGRGWRSVEDTTHDPIFAARRPKPFASLSRSEDYYSEGALIWLEADQIIRAGTGGRRGLDDFASRFFGIRGGDWGQVTYTFDDIVADLNAIHPYDWATFLSTRMQRPNQSAPLAGIEMAGYRLVWKEEPNSYDKSRVAKSKTLELGDSIGATIDKDAKVTSVRWDSPAFAAGLVTGAKIIAVNGRAYDQDRIKEAITEARTSGQPISLLVQRGETFATVPIAWTGGLRWPWLEPAGKGPQRLDRLLAPRTR